MNQFKRAQVVILPTNQDIPKVNDIILNIHEKSELDIVTKHNIFNKESFRFGKFGITFRNSYSYNGFENNHLYITSDDEIKEDDWFITPKEEVHQFVRKARNHNYNSLCKKIIATTDTSLKLHDNNGNNHCFGTQLSGNCKHTLPQLSQQFIEKYIESYNKGEVITDVLVEYEQLPRVSIFSEYESGIQTSYGHKLKINPKDNTITIKKLKDSWNREEIENLLENYRQFTWKAGSSKQDLINWIKDNL